MWVAHLAMSAAMSVCDVCESYRPHSHPPPACLYTRLLVPIPSHYHHPQVGHRSGKTAPFGLDPTNAPYVTEQARPNGTGGPRGQQMNGSSPPRREPALGGREGASGGVLSGFDHLQRQAAAAQSQPALPGAIAQSLYDRDVNKVGSAAPHTSSFVYSPPGTAGGGAHPHPLAVGNASGNADLTRHGGSAKIGLHHSAAPANRGGSRLDQFTNGAGQMDDWVDAAHRGFPAPPDEVARRAQQARQPSHAYETEMFNPRGSYHLSQMGIERASGASTPPPTAASGKHRSRIGGHAPDGTARPRAMSPVPFSTVSTPPRPHSPQPTGGDAADSNPFSSRLRSPLNSNRSTPRSAARAASGVDQIRRYGQGSRAATPPATPPLTPTGGGGRTYGRPTGSQYVSDPRRGSPPQPQPQVQSAPPQVRSDWRGVPAIREGPWGGHGRAPSPRAWRREGGGEGGGEGGNWMYEA